MSHPAVTRIRQINTHRLVPTKYSENGYRAFIRIADNDEHIRGIVDLDLATDDRPFAEHDLLPGIGVNELVFAVPHFRIINAAFLHAHPLGSRFNGPDRSAWYAGFDLETSQAEVAWHKSGEFAEIDRLEESIDYDDYLADFGGEFHDIRGDAAYRQCLDPDSYVESQLLAENLLGRQALGIIYPSARHVDGVCLACFRPALVSNVRRSARYSFTWAGSREPKIEFEESYM